MWLMRFLSQYVNIVISGKSILKVWYMMNILLTTFFGFFHQAGVTQLAEYMSKYHAQVPATTQIRLFTSHIYSIPESLLVIPSSKILYTNLETGRKFKIPRRFFVHEYGSLELKEMFKKMKIILDAAETKGVNYEHFISVPSSKAFELNQLFYEHRKLIAYKQETIFYPHLSTEAFPSISTTSHPCEINTNVDEHDETCKIDGDLSEIDSLSVENVLRRLSSIAHQFGLVLYRVEIRRKKKA
jgi:phosphatidylinositol glycan class Z